MKDSPLPLRFAGVSLGGGKTDKTAVAQIEYFPEQKRIFLKSLFTNVASVGDKSSDLALHEILTEHKFKYVAFDTPLSLPLCMTCELKCPGFEKCKLPHIKWMWEYHNKRHKSKRPNKLFTPYTERCVEMYISSELEENFFPSHALGANAAPLAARAHFVARRLKKLALIEVYPKLSLWRIGLSLDIPKSYLRFHRHSMDGDEARYYILSRIIESNIAFIYQQDLRAMVENMNAFDAFIAALTAYLKHRVQTEPRPKDFPKLEAWIEFPKQKITWF